MERAPAVILKHPAYDAVLDASGRVIAPVQAEAAIRPSGPWDDNAPQLLTEDQHQTLDAQEAIQRLAANLGSYRRLMTLVRNIAFVATGERL